MAVTSTAIVATNAVIKIDNASGTPVDVSGQSNSVELSAENGIAEFRPFSTQWNIRKVVGKDVTLSISGVVSGNDAEAYGLLRGWFFDGVDTSRTITFQTPDGNAGSDEYTGEYVLSTFTFPHDSEADEFVMWDAEFLPNGAVTHSEITS